MYSSEGRGWRDELKRTSTYAGYRDELKRTSPYAGQRRSVLHMSRWEWCREGAGI